MNKAQFIICSILILSSCKSTEQPVCCAFPEPYEKPEIEIPQETIEHIFDVGEHSNTRQSTAFTVARINAEAAIQATLNDRTALFLKDQEFRTPEDFENVDPTVISRLEEIFQESINSEMFSSPDLKTDVTPDGLFDCVVLAKFDKKLFLYEVRKAVSLDSITVNIDIDLFEDYFREAFKMN